MRKIFFLSLVFVFMILAMPVMAQTEELADPTLISAESTETFELEGVEVEEINKIPSAFGLWWRSVKENVSLVFTFDPVKKAEKSLQFAENRMQLAEAIAEKATDPKVQEKANKMIEKAQMFMEKVEAGKDKWAAAETSEKKRMLMKNVANFQVRKEKAMNRIEEKIPEEKKGEFNELREKGLKGSQRLINALENEKISKETRVHLQAVKTRIEEHATLVRGYIEERKAIQERIKSGEEGAKEELQLLNEERRMEIRLMTDEYKATKEQIRTKAQEGDEAAQKQLQIMNRVENAVQERIQQRTENGNRPVSELNRGATTNKIPLNGKKPAVDTINRIPGGMGNSLTE